MSKISPYNFISLLYEKDKASTEVGNLTGYLDLRIELFTDLIIPNTSNDNFYNLTEESPEHKSYGYYSYEDLKGKFNKQILPPIIPGSSIRGAIRSVHEALHNSCLSTISSDVELWDNLPVDSYIEGYEPCTGKTDEPNCIDLCPTCKIFGTINGKFTYPSKIRFTDFEQCFYEESKCKNCQFKKCDYKKNDTRHNNSYDKRTIANLLSPTIKSFNLYGYSDEYKYINGRKFYWHHSVDKKQEKITKFNGTYTPITAYTKDKKLNVFEGKVYFEKLTIDELNGLIKAVTLVDNDHLHKIGHGKPLGYGSVNIVLNKIVQRKLNVLADGLEYQNIDIKPSLVNNSLKYSIDGKEQTIEPLSFDNENDLSELAFMTYCDAVDNYKIDYYTKDDNKKDIPTVYDIMWEFNSNKKNK